MGSCTPAACLRRSATLHSLLLCSCPTSLYTALYTTIRSAHPTSPIGLRGQCSPYRRAWLERRALSPPALLFPDSADVSIIIRATLVALDRSVSARPPMPSRS